MQIQVPWTTFFAKITNNTSLKEAHKKKRGSGRLQDKMDNFLPINLFVTSLKKKKKKVGEGKRKKEI